MSTLPAELSRWTTRALNAEHLTGFLNSDRPEIDVWLHEQALRLQEEAFCRTFVWADQPPYVAGFFTLVPHRIGSDEATRVPGHAGGALSGYLIGKIGIHKTAGQEESLLPGETDLRLANRYLLLIDAVVRAGRASYFAGGRYVFLDLNNEPEWLMEAALRIGFNSISPEGDTMHVMKVRRPTVVPSGAA